MGSAPGGGARDPTGDPGSDAAPFWSITPPQDGNLGCMPEHMAN